MFMLRSDINKEHLFNYSESSLINCFSKGELDFILERTEFVLNLQSVDERPLCGDATAKFQFTYLFIFI